MRTRTGLPVIALFLGIILGAGAIPLATAAEVNPYQAGLKAMEQGQWFWAVKHFGEALDANLQPYEAHLARGRVLYLQRDYPRAQMDFEAAARLRPGELTPVTFRAETLMRRHAYAEARRGYERAVGLRREDSLSHNSLAWLLATCPEAAVRDGGKAVVEAREAVRLSRSASAYYLDTLAAACAEAGRFDEAVQHQTEAMARLGPPGQDPSKMAGKIRAHLSLYRARQPLRDEP